MTGVTQILASMERGAPHAAEQLLPLVYDELRKLAAAKLAQEKPGQMLQATALVHEAYVRLVDGEQPQRWDSRGHFSCSAAEAMRRILVESARHRRRLKHGGNVERVALDAAAIAAPEIDVDLIALDAALDRLQAKDLRKAELVKLRYFAGLTVDEAARALGIGASTADRDWAYARAWLFREITGGSE